MPYGYRSKRARRFPPVRLVERTPSRVVVGLVGGVLGAIFVVTGCTSDTSNNAGTTTQKSPVVPSTSATNNGSTGPSATLDEALPQLELERLDVDLDAPITAIPLPRPSDEAGGNNEAGENDEAGGNGLIVAERAGVVRVIDLDESAPSLSEPVIDISDNVSTDGERGLLGIALNPDHDRLFLSYTDAKGNSQLDMYDASWRDTEKKRSGDKDGADGKGPARLVVDKSSRKNLLSVEQPYSNHNGGHIEFGPDGMLYLGLGDGGSGGDPHGNAQKRSTLLGKLLRLDPAKNPSDGLAPQDNPFVDESRARPEIWSTGLRNPWRFSFDPKAGDLWVADVGQDRFEEINRVTPENGGAAKGANFGWDLYEGTERFNKADPAPPPASDGPFVDPIHTYAHDPGCSVTGGVVYRGSAISGLQGRYLFSDLCDGTIRSLQVSQSGESSVDDLGIDVEQPVGFAVDSEGEAYVISLSDGVYRIRASTGSG